MKSTIYLTFCVAFLVAGPVLADQNQTHPTLAETLSKASQALVSAVHSELAKLHSDNLHDLTWAINFHLSILEPISRELHDRIEAKAELDKDYVNNLAEQLISTESSLGVQLQILIEVVASEHMRNLPTSINTTAQAQALLAHAYAIVEQYPNAKEIPSVKSEIHDLQVYLGKNDGKAVESVLDRAQKSLDVLEEMASYRLPMKFGVLSPKNVPEKVNITQQLTIHNLLTSMETSYTSQNASLHRKISNFTTHGHAHLLGAFNYQVSLLENLLSHVHHQLSNETQFFPLHYLRVLIEEDNHLGNELQKQEEIINQVIAKNESNLKKLTQAEVLSRAKLLQSLSKGMISQHPHLTEGPAFQKEIAGLQMIIIELSSITLDGKSLAEHRLAIDRFQATMEHLTRSSNWNMGHAGGYL